MELSRGTWRMERGRGVRRIVIESIPYAVNKAKLVEAIGEATGVEPEGRITPNCLGIWKDEHVPALRRVTDFVTEHGSVPGIQLGVGEADRPARSR